jgi:phosphate transport system substrate-binding protein
MFIVTPEDVEIVNIQHPKDKDRQVPILHYGGHKFYLADVFGDNRNRAVTFSRHLTENMGKLCVLLEEPHCFSVWDEVKEDQYNLLAQEYERERSVNGAATELQPEGVTPTAASQSVRASSEPAEPPSFRAELKSNSVNGDRDEDRPPVESEPQSAQPQPLMEVGVQPTQPRLVAWDLEGQKRKRSLAALGLILLTGLGLAGLGYWFLQSSSNRQASTSTEIVPPQTSSQPIPGVTIDASLPNPKVLTIDGSTTMVELVQRLRNAYAERYPNIPTTYGQPDGRPGGSNQGLDALLDGSVVLAASSRPLKPKEAEAGIQVVAIAHDAIAVVVGVNNPFKGGLSTDRLRRIYQGKITNWSELGGANMPIRVIDRAKSSGTRDMFQNIVLVGQEFAPDSPNFITWPRDETTDVLKILGKDGIYYTTMSQVKEQELVRIVPIEETYPNDMVAVQSGKYPISRNVYLAFPKPTSPAVKEFIDLTLSPQGQQIVQKSGFMPLLH